MILSLVPNTVPVWCWEYRDEAEMLHSLRSQQPCFWNRLAFMLSTEGLTGTPTELQYAGIRVMGQCTVHYEDVTLATFGHQSLMHHCI